MTRWVRLTPVFERQLGSYGGWERRPGRRRKGLRRLIPRPEMVWPRKPGAPKIWRPPLCEGLIVSLPRPLRSARLGVATLQEKGKRRPSL